MMTRTLQWLLVRIMPFRLLDAINELHCEQTNALDADRLVGKAFLTAQESSVLIVRDLLDRAEKAGWRPVRNRIRIDAKQDDYWPVGDQ